MRHTTVLLADDHKHALCREPDQRTQLFGYRNITRAFPLPAAPTLSSTPRQRQCLQRAGAAAVASPAWVARRLARRAGGG
jgi:hypothetical protein